jgi:hypothetical protein
VLGNGADIGTNGDEVVIILPSGNEMKMQMIGDACAGDLSQVQADVDAVGVQVAADNSATAGEQQHQLEMLALGEPGEISHMTPRRQQEMTIGVGKTIEQGNGKFVTKKQKMGFVKRGIARRLEQATVIRGC